MPTLTTDNWLPVTAGSAHEALLPEYLNPSLLIPALFWGPLQGDKAKPTILSNGSPFEQSQPRNKGRSTTNKGQPTSSTNSLAMQSGDCEGAR